MKVLLVQPPNEFIKQAYGVKSKVKFGHAPPLGLGYIASYLERDGHVVKILDASALELDMEGTLDAIDVFDPDLVGITVLTNYADVAKSLATGIKERRPDTTTVLGGPHATYFYTEILQDMPGFDHVIYGEADTVISDYVRFLHDPKSLHRLQGLVYRDERGGVVVNPPAAAPGNLDDCPSPTWHLFDMSLYRPLPMQYRQRPFFTMITSRGCWWQRCKFCFQAGSCSAKYRRQSPERVVDEIEVLYHKYGIRELAFWDDTFIMKFSWLKRFTMLLQQRQLRISWTASGRCDTMNEKMLQTIREAGCWSIFVGFESGNQELLDLIDKGITLDQARTVAQITRKVGIEVRGAFMLGLPGETPEMGEKTIRFALELDPDWAIFYATHPRYGTKLYDIAMQSGTFLDRNFRGMTKVTYVPVGYANADELARTVRHAYRRFYLRPRFMLRKLRRIRAPRDVVELGKGLLLFLGLTGNQ